MAQFKELGGGGGSVNVVVPGEWSGTTVPNTGPIENVYWNTSLSMDEINEILANANLTYVDFEGLPVYGVLAALVGENPVALIGIVDASAMLGGSAAYAAIDMVNGQALFCTSASFAAVMDIAFGWNTDLVANNGLISLNAELIPSLEDMGFSSVGEENDKLTALFSLSPIVKAEGETFPLEGEYDGSEITLSNIKTVDVKALLHEKKLPLSISIKSYENGTVVPNEGYVEKIYMNNALPPNEVIEILNSITEWETLGEDSTTGWYVYIVYRTVEKFPQIVVQKLLDNGICVYSIQYTATESSTTITPFLFGISSSGGIEHNWNIKEAVYTMPVYNEAISSYINVDTGETITVGNENDKLTRLFSTTPFVSNMKQDIAALNNFVIKIKGAIPEYTYSNFPVSAITILDGVTNINSYAFDSCSYLRTIELLSDIMSIEECAFNKCYGLTDVYYKGTESQWEAISISENNDSLNNATIHYNYFAPGLYETGTNKMTKYWDELVSDGTVTVDYDGTITLSNMYMSGDLVISDSVTSIGEQAFDSRSSLTGVTIPSSVTNIGDSAFDMCRTLSSVSISDGVVSIGRSAFENCYYLTSVEIPNSVTFIDSYAFTQCGLTNVTISNSITSISLGTFESCSSLLSVEIPNGVTSIGENAFYACKKLSSVTIPDSVTIIGKYALGACYVLTNIYYNGTKEQWRAIIKDVDWADDTPDNLIIHCEDGDLDKNMNEV